MIPAIPTKEMSRVNDMGSSSMSCNLIALDEPGCERQHPETTFTHPLIGGVMPARASSMGTCEPLNGPPACEQRASTTSGAPFTNSITCSTPSTGTR